MKHSYRKEFYGIYTNKLFPKFVKYEKYRKKIIFRLILDEVLFLIIVAGCYKAFIVNFMNMTAFAWWCRIMVACSCVLTIYMMYSLPIYAVKEFKKKLKKECLADAIACFEGLTKAYSVITNSQIVSSQLFSDFNEVDFDDEFYCKYKNVEFSVSEVLLKYTDNSGRRTAYKDVTAYKVFKGVIIRIPADKKVNAHTIITSKGDIRIKRNIFQGFFIYVASMFLVYVIILSVSFGIFDMRTIIAALSALITSISVLIVDRKRNKIKLSKLNLEDVSFDKRFCVQSQDQVEGRYLVTPAFMDKLNNLRLSFGTKDIKCAFFDNQVMFAISTDKDLFELGNLFVPLSDSKQISEFYNEIVSIYDMIDYFKLYKK